MVYHFYLTLLLMVIIVLIGVAVTFSGIEGVWKRRPVYIVTRGISIPLYILSFVIWTIIAAASGIEILENHNRVSSGWGIVIVFIVSVLLGLLVGVWIPYLRSIKSPEGVKILGINKKVLNLLRQSLGKEGIAFRETQDEFYLEDQKAIIYFSIWRGIGYASIRIFPADTFSRLSKIISEMRKYDNDHTDHFSIKFMILQILIGTLIIGIGLTFIYFIIGAIVQ